MGHAHECVIKHLRRNMEGGPNQTTKTPTGACKGCKKGKFKILSFLASQIRAKQPPDLVHSNPEEMSVLSIGGYKYITTYLDNCTALLKEQKQRVHCIQSLQGVG